ncbi:hypothetical protein BGC07_10870 [Piscirickettsia litoralis]|uniref:Uncharacterized protein n=1 Tax=Piscirickettsia litoralis TaxID=1891921 RepID=A0ABX3AB18_9GAMM|nr:hypothetical protein BGC07_10870 [Piscirickettsia litoralis]
MSIITLALLLLTRYPSQPDPEKTTQTAIKLTNPSLPLQNYPLSTLPGWQEQSWQPLWTTYLASCQKLQKTLTNHFYYLMKKLIIYPGKKYAHRHCNLTKKNPTYKHTHSIIFN